MNLAKLNSSQVQWLVLSGTEKPKSGAHDSNNLGVDKRPARLLSRISGLQETHLAHSAACIWGQGAGCLDALWLAEQYDVRLLVLEDWPVFGQDRRMERLCLRNLFAVVCPVVMLMHDGIRPPEIPNARTYMAKDEAHLYEIVEMLLREKGDRRANAGQ